jgi:hypothetical protein
MCDACPISLNRKRAIKERIFVANKRTMSDQGSDQGGPSSPIFARYEERLFELYTRFRYNELVCRSLMRKAASLERWVRGSVLATLAISLLSGIVPGMNRATLNWIWGSFTTAATLLTIYSLSEGSGEKQYTGTQLAMRFHSFASQVEFFSHQVRLGKITEVELAETWRAFTSELDDLVARGGIAFLEYEEEHRSELTEELAVILRREKRAS